MACGMVGDDTDMHSDVTDNNDSRQLDSCVTNYLYLVGDNV